jgi:hypothetical protein
LDETISFLIDKQLKARYTSVYDMSTGKLRIGEIDFLLMVVGDFEKSVSFRFLFDYDNEIKKGILQAIRSDRDVVVNKLMVDLNQQLNIHDVPFQGADEVEDVERYRELDERVDGFRKGSSAREDIIWLEDWIAALADESDQPDIKALEAIYRKFLRVTGYNMDYDMLSPKELLKELKTSNEYQPTLQETVVSAVDRKRYKDLEDEISESLFEIYGGSDVHWLMQFVAEWRIAKSENKRANVLELERLYTLYLIETDRVDTELDPIELLKELEK